MSKASNEVVIAGLDAMLAVIGSGGFLKVYQGTIPEDCQTVAAGTLLATHDLSTPAYGSASADLPGGRASATAGAIADDVAADATGTAQYWRLTKTDGTTACFQGDVSGDGGGGELQYTSVNFVAGGLVTITDFALMHLSEGVNP